MVGRFGVAVVEAAAAVDMRATRHHVQRFLLVSGGDHRRRVIAVAFATLKERGVHLLARQRRLVLAGINGLVRPRHLAAGRRRRKMVALR